MSSLRSGYAAIGGARGEPRTQRPGTGLQGIDVNENKKAPRARRRASDGAPIAGMQAGANSTSIASANVAKDEHDRPGRAPVDVAAGSGNPSPASYKPTLAPRSLPELMALVFAGKVRWDETLRRPVVVDLTNDPPTLGPDGKPVHLPTVMDLFLLAFRNALEDPRTSAKAQAKWMEYAMDTMKPTRRRSSPGRRDAAPRRHSESRRRYRADS